MAKCVVCGDGYVDLDGEPCWGCGRKLLRAALADPAVVAAVLKETKIDDLRQRIRNGSERIGELIDAAKSAMAERAELRDRVADMEAELSALEAT